METLDQQKTLSFFIWKHYFPTATYFQYNKHNQPLFIMIFHVFKFLLNFQNFSGRYSPTCFQSVFPNATIFFQNNNVPPASKGRISFHFRTCQYGYIS